MNNQFLLFTAALLIFIYSCKKEETLPTNNTICFVSEDNESIVADAETYQHQFESADPSLEDNNLDLLIEHLGKAKIVGLGEATHGSKEFYQMKDKIFRQLVVKKGFKAIVFELPWGNCQLVDEYVFKNERSLEEVVAQIPYWVYQTQEVADLIEWMHDYNLDKSEEDKIHFLGNDPQGRNFATEKKIVLDFINKAAVDSLSFVRNALANLPSDLFEGNYPESISIHDKNQMGIQAVLNFLIENRDELLDVGDKNEYEIVLFAMKVIAGREEVYRTQNHGTLRDQLMAEYSEAWRTILGNETKIAVWAHNFHVSNVNFGATSQSMGYFLKQMHSKAYQIVAFGFGTGGVNAFLTDGNFGFAGFVRAQNVDRLVCNSVNHFISEASGDKKYFIFEQMPVGSDLYQFLAENQEWLSIGAGFNATFLERHFYLSRRVLRENDVLIFFDEVEASELL